MAASSAATLGGITPKRLLRRDGVWVLEVEQWESSGRFLVTVDRCIEGVELIGIALARGSLIDDLARGAQAIIAGADEGPSGGYEVIDGAWTPASLARALQSRTAFGPESSAASSAPVANAVQSADTVSPDAIEELLEQLASLRSQQAALIERLEELEQTVAEGVFAAPTSAPDTNDPCPSVPDEWPDEDEDEPAVQPEAAAEQAEEPEVEEAEVEEPEAEEAEAEAEEAEAEEAEAEEPEVEEPEPTGPLPEGVERMSPPKLNRINDLLDTLTESAIALTTGGRSGAALEDPENHYVCAITNDDGETIGAVVMDSIAVIRVGSALLQMDDDEQQPQIDVGTPDADSLDGAAEACNTMSTVLNSVKSNPHCRFAGIARLDPIVHGWIGKVRDGEHWLVNKGGTMDFLARS